MLRVVVGRVKIAPKLEAKFISHEHMLRTKTFTQIFAGDDKILLDATVTNRTDLFF